MSRQINSSPMRSQRGPRASLALLVVLAMTTISVVPAQAATPTLTSFSPLVGQLGAEVTLVGSGFSADQITVRFGLSPVALTDLDVVSDTSIKVKVPSGSGEVNLLVETLAGSALSAAKFTYAPTIASLSASSGPLGGANQVVIEGASFLDVSAVTFGGVAATKVMVVSSTRIEATAPRNPAGLVNVVVSAKGGVATRESGYAYANLPPTLTSLSKASGPVTGGTTVVILGTNFYAVSGAGAVRFGEKNATSYTVNSLSQITAIAPAGALGTVSVSVVASDGTATLSGAFVYREASSQVNATERIFFTPGRSDVRSSQFAKIQQLLDASAGKLNVQISLASRRHVSSSRSLGKARNESVKQLLDLAGLRVDEVHYSLFNLKRSSGGSSAKKNNRVQVSISWTN